MTLRTHFDSGSFLKNGESGRREVAFLFPRLVFRLPFCFRHTATLPRIGKDETA
jgi:hypothetical protein